MARRVSLPASKIRRKRRVMRTRLAIVIGVALLLLLGIIVGISWLPFLRVQAVEVSGVETLATSTVSDLSLEMMEGRVWLVFPKNNIIIYPKAEIAHDLLSQYPVLKSADVHAASFESISIGVAERHAAARWCPGTPENPGSGSDCLYLDPDGYGFGPADGDLDFVTYFGAMATSGLPALYLQSGQFVQLSALAASLSQIEPDSPVVQLGVDSIGDGEAVFDNGFSLLFVAKDAGGDIYQ